MSRFLTRQTFPIKFSFKISNSSHSLLSPPSTRSTNLYLLRHNYKAYYSSATITKSQEWSLKQTFKKYTPQIYEYLLWSFFGSFALHLLWVRIDYNDYRERVMLKIAKLKDDIAHLERGEEIKIEEAFAPRAHKYTFLPKITNDYLKNVFKSEEIYDTKIDHEQNISETTLPETPQIKNSKWI